MNITVVSECALGNICQPLHGIFIFIRDWFITQIAARHDQYCRLVGFNILNESMQQQMMQRGVGQHNAECIIARRNIWCYWAVRTPREQHNRTTVRLE